LSKKFRRQTTIISIKLDADRCHVRRYTM